MNIMNPLAALALFLSPVFAGARCPAQEQVEALSSEAVLAAISTTIGTVAKLHDVPAVSTCVVVGEDSYFMNHGTLRRDSEERVDEESIYQIASLSKTFAGLTVHRLVRDGVVELGDSIADYLPAGVDEATRRKVQPISVRDLLTHRSGLPRDTLNPKSRQKGTYVNYDYDEADLLQDLSAMKLEFAAGERFMYSNYGYALLGYVLERVTKKEYGLLVQEHVTGPIEMSDTGFELAASSRDRLVTPYAYEDRSVAREPARTGKLAPPSALYSTTSDLAKLMRKQLAEYRQFEETGEVTELILTHEREEAWAGSGISYGLGFLDWGNGTLGNSGGMDGYGSEFSFNPKSDVGFVLLTSSVEAWTQRLNVAVLKAVIDGRTDALDELVAVESIIAEFDERGAEAALALYQGLRNQKPSPLGEDARVTLVNLSAQAGMADAAKLFASDARADFPDSKRIKALGK